MKPFNLQEALAGKPVCTRGGLPVRIFCGDLKDATRPVVGAIMTRTGTVPVGGKMGGKEVVVDREEARCWTLSGRLKTDGMESSFDLFMASKTVERIGWMNLYPPDEQPPALTIYRTLKEARDNREYNEVGEPVAVVLKWEE
jgi:hypothetical protein